MRFPADWSLHGASTRATADPRAGYGVKPGMEGRIGMGVACVLPCLDEVL